MDTETTKGKLIMLKLNCQFKTEKKGSENKKLDYLITLIHNSSTNQIIFHKTFKNKKFVFIIDGLQLEFLSSII